MNIKPVLPLFIAAIPLILWSFSKPLPAAGSPGKGYAFVTARGVKSDTGGRVVSLDSIQSCIDKYVSLMAAHGFTAQAGDPINILLTSTSRITLSETFIGKDLQIWLNKTATQFAAAHKTLMIKMQLGVYDSVYLKRYQPDPVLRAASLNRIAIFIIPYDGSSGQPVHAAGVQPSGGSGGGGTGYDLGGIQP